MNLAHLFICTGPTCADAIDRDGQPKPPIDIEALKQRWKDERLYGTVHLTFAGCLGRCNTANQALLVTGSAPQYFMKLTADGLIDELVAWAKAAAEAGVLPPLPAVLAEAVYERVACS